MNHTPKGSKPRGYKTTTVQLPTHTMDALDVIATTKECSRATVIRQLLTEGLRRMKTAAHTHEEHA